MRIYEFYGEQLVSAPRPEVFAFFADAANLDAITPPWMRFRIVTPMPVEMAAGVLLDYRLRYHGVPLRWRTRIEAWQPEVLFVDLQVRGPYRLWHHTHRFEPTVGGGTQIIDIVRYALPLGPLGAVAHWLTVRRDVAAIFDYRRGEIAERFGGG